MWPSCTMGHDLQLSRASPGQLQEGNLRDHTRVGFQVWAERSYKRGRSASAGLFQPSSTAPRRYMMQSNTYPRKPPFPKTCLCKGVLIAPAAAAVAQVVTSDVNVLLFVMLLFAGLQPCRRLCWVHQMLHEMLWFVPGYKEYALMLVPLFLWHFIQHNK